MWITSVSGIVMVACMTTEREVASVLAPIIVVTDPASAERVETTPPEPGPETSSDCTAEQPGPVEP